MSGYADYLRTAELGCLCLVFGLLTTACTSEGGQSDQNSQGGGDTALVATANVAPETRDSERDRGRGRGENHRGDHQSGRWSGGSSSTSTDGTKATDTTTPTTADPLLGDYAVLAANDLGMHCADQDYQVFSILPPFNVLHAQVIQRGINGQLPKIIDNTLAEVNYFSTSNINDPAGSSSINMTSQNLPGIIKSNFWKPSANGTLNVEGTAVATIGGEAYGPLYPNAALAGTLLPTPMDLAALCADPANWYDCPSALALFDPLPVNAGIPVPDPRHFYPVSGSPVAVLGTQHMPGLANTPQKFDRYDIDMPFFINFGFGARLLDVNWFAADGIPILPVDDSGRSNSYPLMTVEASDKATGQALASVDVVLPVASEADCQNCHVEPVDCANPNLPLVVQSTSCSGSAMVQTDFVAMTLEDNPPGDTILQQLLNAAKTNILRLHDAKHGSLYQNWEAGVLVAKPCDAATDPNDPNCLANQTPIQCSRCHYSPALDLLQTGPVDEPAQGLKGRQQTYHITMSSAMHGHHGSLPAFEGKELFPPMPGPIGRSEADAQAVLGETCYQCHPGKRTKCLRGAMFSGGVVCQDCHGDMQQVGNDFSVKVSSSNQGDFVMDGSLRVPWASEPACQSCHTGDANNLNHPAGAVVAADGIRLLQAYQTAQVSVDVDGDGTAESLKVASVIKSPNSRFAENQAQNQAGQRVDLLYRLSKGHGGVMCEGCHGSTHAIWPNANIFANDNVAANQLQGHSGTITECDTCHEAGSLGRTLDGPHGMHPVDAGWVDGHENMAESQPDACRACHGANGEGTVLSRMSTTRTMECEGGANCQGGQITLSKGDLVTCSTCHSNKL